MAIVEGVRQELLGDGLLTINVDVTPADAGEDVIELKRAWSSQPQFYPVSGRKRKRMTPWTQQLLRRAKIFVGEGDGSLADVFDDYQVIASMGLHSVVNVPLVTPEGRCFATFNVLGSRTSWTDQELVQIEMLAAFALPVICRMPIAEA